MVIEIKYFQKTYLQTQKIGVICDIYNILMYNIK